MTLNQTHREREIKVKPLPRLHLSPLVCLLLVEPLRPLPVLLGSPFLCLPLQPHILCPAAHPLCPSFSAWNLLAVLLPPDPPLLYLALVCPQGWRQLGQGVGGTWWLLHLSAIRV